LNILNKFLSIRKIGLLLGLLLILSSFVLVQVARGCIALSNSGAIGINHEVAVIIWDKNHHTEHFIRSATLDSKDASAGFLVPTPTTPELAVADARIFDLVEKYLPIYRSDSAPIPASILTSKSPIVVAEQDIGDYHAVTLDATDATGLGVWLKKNGYAWTAGSAQWLEPYLTAKWKITAFKLRGSGSGELTTNAIRMSFVTDHPFFPYSEPAEASQLSGPNRTLRIAILSDERMTGKLGDGTDWAGHLDLARSTTPPLFAHVDKNDWLKYAKFNDKPEIQLPKRLTYFSDYSNPRPGKSDLFFSASPDQADYSP
jgi:hypothetical protein